MTLVMVDGQPTRVAAGAMLLKAIRAAGVSSPTLCYHEGRAPHGACRLCMVAVTHPRATLVAACAFPVEDGLVVETRASPAVAARRLALEFLLSRVPQSDVIPD